MEIVITILGIVNPSSRKWFEAAATISLNYGIMGFSILLRIDSHYLIMLGGMIRA